MTEEQQEKIAEALSAFPGMQIRSYGAEAEGHPEISKLHIEIFPLPTELLNDLNQVIIAAAHQFLIEKKIVTDERTDLASAGTATH